jgi:hypothetical protein
LTRIKAVQRALAMMSSSMEEENVMPFETMVVVAGVLSMFGIFAGALVYGMTR